MVKGIKRNNSVKFFEFEPVVQEMSFKDISYQEPLWPFCSVEWNHLCNFCRGYQEEQFCEIILNLVQEEMYFKDISNLEPWRPFCSVERCHLCNFGRGYQEEQF